MAALDRAGAGGRGRGRNTGAGAGGRGRGTGAGGRGRAWSMDSYYKDLCPNPTQADQSRLPDYALDKTLHMKVA
jgi:hypothetical protein